MTTVCPAHSNNDNSTAIIIQNKQGCSGDKLSLSGQMYSCSKEEELQELEEVDKMVIVLIHSAQSWVHKKQREVQQRTGGAKREHLFFKLKAKLSMVTDGHHMKGWPFYARFCASPQICLELNSVNFFHKRLWTKSDWWHYEYENPSSLSSTVIKQTGHGYSRTRTCRTPLFLRQVKKLVLGLKSSWLQWKADLIITNLIFIIISNHKTTKVHWGRKKEKKVWGCPSSPH